ncbi:FAS-associated death domain protein [Lepisosteus oculatus]|uniref:FAS-associated death domain protein n=1 Tax=Lepisosteus oculatus TaxID=7918 RepID=UPI0035F51861
MSGFLDVLYQISQRLSKDNLNSLKFLCVEDIKKKKLEQIHQGTELFQCLIEMNKIGPDSTEFLHYLLGHIDRQDLIELLQKFERDGPAGLNDNQPDVKEREKLDAAFGVIVENMGRDWRMFARKLGITDAKLDHIREKHPFNMEEQVREVLRVWQKTKGKEAKVMDLIEKLRECKMNLTADFVEKIWTQ